MLESKILKAFMRRKRKWFLSGERPWWVNEGLNCKIAGFLFMNKLKTYCNKKVFFFDLVQDGGQ